MISFFIILAKSIMHISAITAACVLAPNVLCIRTFSTLTLRKCDYNEECMVCHWPHSRWAICYGLNVRIRLQKWTMEILAPNGIDWWIVLWVFLRFSIWGGGGGHEILAFFLMGFPSAWSAAEDLWGFSFIETIWRTKYLSILCSEVRSPLFETISN